MLYIGHFLHTTNQEEELDLQRRYGEFNLVLSAESNQEAIDKFKERIINMRNTSDYFEGESFVYFVQLLEFDEFPKNEAMVLNYKSYPGDPLNPCIVCSTRHDNNMSCRVFNWDNNIPEIDGQNEIQFLEFKTDL